VFAVVNGVRTFYETVGQGPPLIAVHGGPGMSDHRGYARWLRPLADTHQLVYYDLRGCGQSDDAADGSYTHADFVADLDALRAYLYPDRVAVMGTSYGGFIALEYALRHQDHLTHLVLADTAPSNHHHEAATQTALASGLPGISHALLDALFMGRMRDDDEFRRAYAAIQPLYRTTADPAEDRRALESIVFRYRTHNFAFSHNLPSYDLRDRLSEIATPTLVLCGREDWITPLDQSEYMAAHIPGAELAVYDHSGHRPMREENDAFIARIRGFLDAPSMVATTAE